MVELYSDLDSEEEQEEYEEVYTTPRVRVAPYNTNRKDAKGGIRKAIESRPEIRLRNRNVDKSTRIPFINPVSIETGEEIAIPRPTPKVT